MRLDKIPDDKINMIEVDDDDRMLIADALVSHRRMLMDLIENLPKTDKASLSIVGGFDDMADRADLLTAALLSIIEKDDGETLTV